jgi:hypothetical protein
MNVNEWSVEVSDSAQIFVAHLVNPKFRVQLIIYAEHPDSYGVQFKGKWDNEIPPSNPMEWYLNALEFYKNTPEHKTGRC